MTADERERLVAVAHAHATAEGEGDLEATMATLDDDPVYELMPMGRVLRGRDAARRYYEHFFATCRPRVRGYELRSEWVTDEGVGQEYTLYLREQDGSTRRHDIIGILTFGTGGKLSGERIYASDDLIETMLGPLLHEAVPV
ncbi:MAG TPA: nuclear transport factor 2 family protein [Acidimicrobiia bacterium]|nr:nuclear transport factor 2 family protein [Acidimicrobiia bacterium]